MVLLSLPSDAITVATALARIGTSPPVKDPGLHARKLAGGTIEAMSDVPESNPLCLP